MSKPAKPLHELRRRSKNYVGLYQDNHCLCAICTKSVRGSLDAVFLLRAVNSFSDLKALAEPLKELEIGNVKGYYDKDKWLILDEGSNRIGLLPSEIPQFILNLRRLVFTAEQEVPNE